jgi:hypothetical protein
MTIDDYTIDNQQKGKNATWVEEVGGTNEGDGGA